MPRMPGPPYSMTGHNKKWLNVVRPDLSPSQQGASLHSLPHDLGQVSCTKVWSVGFGVAQTCSWSVAFPLTV